MRKWVIESSFIAECNDGFGTSRFRAPVVQKDFRIFVSGCLVGREFVSFLTKVMSERTISLGVGYEEFAFDIAVMVSKSARS